MKVFKNAWFERFARKNGISDTTLMESIVRAENGLIAADLGGGVIKQRLARNGSGRSGGFRTVILYKKGIHAYFVYGFAKCDRDNIDEEEEAQFRKMARYILGLTEKQVAELIRQGQFWEVNANGKKISQ